MTHAPRISVAHDESADSPARDSRLPLRVSRRTSDALRALACALHRQTADAAFVERVLRAGIEALERRIPQLSADGSLVGHRWPQRDRRKVKSSSGNSLSTDEDSRHDDSSSENSLSTDDDFHSDDSSSRNETT